MATQTTESSLDELAKGLATGTLSRGKAIRWMGGALLGAALAAVPGVAWAEGGRCPQGQTRCGERCVNLRTNERHCGSCSNRCPILMEVSAASIVISATRKGKEEMAKAA
jgi:Stigma-specific protein, Stig1